MPPLEKNELIQAKQHIPARGRKPFIGQVTEPVPAETTYPRKGTETLMILFLHFEDSRRNNISPQGDGNRVLYSSVSMRSGNNISPQGDGNKEYLPNRDWVLPKQHIPARGRKLITRSIQHHHLGNNISPQGDGNSFFVVKHKDHMRNNISPQGDGNQVPCCLKCSPSETTYPRKGTETFDVSCTCSYVYAKQHIPTRGRKLQIILELLSVHKRNNISPQGDGNYKS